MLPLNQKQILIPGITNYFMWRTHSRLPTFTHTLSGIRPQNTPVKNCKWLLICSSCKVKGVQELIFYKGMEDQTIYFESRYKSSLILAKHYFATHILLGCGKMVHSSIMLANQVNQGINHTWIS